MYLFQLQCVLYRSPVNRIHFCARNVFSFFVFFADGRVLIILTLYGLCWARWVRWIHWLYGMCWMMIDNASLENFPFKWKILLQTICQSHTLFRKNVIKSYEITFNLEQQIESQFESKILKQRLNGKRKTFEFCVCVCVGWNLSAN